MSNQRESSKIKSSDAVTKFIKSQGESRRLEYLAERSQLSTTKLKRLRDNKAEPIKYVDALRLSSCSGGNLNMTNFSDRNITDREKYDTPLGRKIALSILNGTVLQEAMEENGIRNNQLQRYLVESATLMEETCDKIKKAFSKNGVKITDEDFEDQHVHHLKTKYLKAKHELEQSRSQQKQSA